MTQHITTHNLGFPRIGGDRELKKAQEAYWRGEIDQAQLEHIGRELRNIHWQLQADAGYPHWRFRLVRSGPDPLGHNR
jgi:5-methyltetrahydropteroyltriglutamate--homocysteine methyltransferase